MRPAIHAQRRACRHIAVHRQRQIDIEGAIRRRCDHRTFRRDRERWRGRAADHRPCEPGPWRRPEHAPRHGFQAVGARRRVGEDHPLHVVHLRARRVIAAGALFGRAIHVAVDPQVQVVQHGRRDRLGGRLVPRHHHIEAAGARRHHNVLVTERVRFDIQPGRAADPAVLGVAREHACARRRLAEPVNVLQRARAVPVVQPKAAASGGEEPRHVAPLEIGVRLHRARHQQRPHRGRPLAQRRHGVHGQRRHAGDGRRRHARAAVVHIPPYASVSRSGGNLDAGPHHMRKKPSVHRGAAAAEVRDLAVVRHRAHGERVLGGGIVHKVPGAPIAGGNRVELSRPPNHGVEFSFDDGARFPKRGADAQAGVQHQRLHGRLRAASGGPGKPVLRSAPSHRRAAGTHVQSLGEPDVPHQRRHPGAARIDGSAANENAGYVGAVPKRIAPEDLVLFAWHAAVCFQVRAAHAAAARRDVQVADVQARVHDADGHRRAADAGEQSAGGIVHAQGVHAHGRRGGVQGGLDASHRFDREHEVRGGDCVQHTVWHVGRVGPRVGVEPSHLGTHVLERAPPTAVGVVRHQRDEHRRDVAEWPLQRLRGEPRRRLQFRRHRADGGHRGELRDLGKPRRVAGEADAQEVAGRADDGCAVTLKRPIRLALVCVRGEARPAEHPIAPGGGLLGKPLPSRVRRQPARRGFNRRLLDHAGLGQAARRHLVKSGESVAFGRRRGRRGTRRRRVRGRRAFAWRDDGAGAFRRDPLDSRRARLLGVGRRFRDLRRRPQQHIGRPAGHHRQHQTHPDSSRHRRPNHRPHLQICCPHNPL